MSKIDTGGDAYPPTIYNLKDNIGREYIDVSPGQTLLDCFAGQVNVNASPRELSSETAEKLVDRQEPKEGVEWIKFWADVKARLKYIEATAMIAEKRRLEALE